MFAHSLLNHKSIFQSHGTIEKRILEYLKKVVKTLDTFWNKQPKTSSAEFCRFFEDEFLIQS